MAEGLSYIGPSGPYGNFSASANGVLAYISASGNSLENRLTWFDRKGAVQGTAGTASQDDSVVLSPDGARAFTFSSGPQNTGLWLLDFKRGTKAPFTFDSSPAGKQVGDCVWSPDGSRVIFVSNRDGIFASLYEKPTSGTTDEVLLLKSNAIKHTRSWSSDGRFLLYDEFDPTTGRSSVWAFALKGDKKPIPVLQGGLRSRQCPNLSRRPLVRLCFR